MLAAGGAPLQTACELLLERHRIGGIAEAITDAVFRQIDIHVPFERRLIEPFENFHCRFVERQRDLERKVSIDLEQHTHTP
jgi:hypothetical protein